MVVTLEELGIRLYLKDTCKILTISEQTYSMTNFSPKCVKETKRL